MIYRLEILQAAEADFSDAIRWYEHIHLPLAHRFKAHIKDAMNKVRQHPSAYATVYQRARRVIVDRFPYNIYFTIEKNTIVVFGILHTSRSPAAWQKRLH